MKNNILNRFAIKDLKNHKKDTIITMFTIFLISMVVMLVTTLTPLITNKKLNEYQNTYGTYNYSSEVLYNDMNEFKEKDIIVHGNTKSYQDYQTCFMNIAGYTLNEEMMFEVIGDYQVIGLQILEGKAPSKSNEIAVKKSVLENWGYEQKANQKIALSYVGNIQYDDIPFAYYITSLSMNGEPQVQEFLVVGILPETNQTDILVCNLPTHACIVYINTGLDDNIDNCIDLNLMYNYDLIDYTNVFTNITTLTMIEAFIIIITVALMYGVTIASFEKRQKDYTLLRSIGATQRQLLYVVFLQSLLLSLLPIILAYLLTILICFIIPMMVSLPVDISMSLDHLKFNIGMIFIVVFISYFIPARSVLRKSLTGNFDGQEFTYFYYRYKKLHRMRPFYLAWRQLIGSKKKMIMKLLLLFLIVVNCMKIIGDINLQYVEKSVYQEVNQKTEINVILDEDNSYKLNIEDFKYLKPYTKDIYSFEYFNYDGSDMFSSSEYYVEKYYKDSQYIQNYFSTKPLNEGEIILSSNFIERNQELKVNDTINFIDKIYKVVQIVEDNNRFMILPKEDYNDFTEHQTFQQQIVMSFDSIQQKTKMLLNCPNEIADLYKHYNVKSISPYVWEFYTNSSTIVLNSGQTLLFIAICAVVYIYQFAYEIYKQRDDIGSYQLLGMTTHEIWKIYFYKSLFIGLVGFISGGIYNFLDRYYIYQGMSEYLDRIMSISYILPVVLISLVIVILFMVLSLIPLWSILRNEAFDNKNVRE